ncbi:WD40-repeat-containing domain protein [Apiosordaria backusii]|uniref:WD40-repeat-containing domain protein n=1 Tax=Apiosordaria backusii TaxID=314023 RepID=A0AA40F0C7_9PEZI|nr:WD40-repeat-containing domain protein [Apiosordaria backusii]
MSMYPGHRMGVAPPANPNANRQSELLDGIRAEFESHQRQIEGYEHQIQVQVQEMQMIREKVYQMEQQHINLKQKYEDEINLLRRQLESRGGGPPGPMNPPLQHAGPSQQPPPQIGNMGGGGVFNGILSGQGGQGAIPPRTSTRRFPISAPQSTASPGPGSKRGQPIGRPPAGGPATPQINTPVPYNGPGQSPQVPTHPTPDHTRMVQHQPPPPPPQSNSLSDLDPERLPNHIKKVKDDWWAIFNQSVPRVLDVDLVHTLQHESVVCCVRFSADGKFVATGCNRSAQIYDVQTGEKVCILQDESIDLNGDLYIRSVCFSPDGQYLATGAEDKLIRVWDIKNRQIRNTFSGHEQDIYSLDFARDGRTIASGSGDRTVRLWDIETGMNTATLTIEDGVTTVAISPDAKYVAAGSLDKSVRVWDCKTGFLLERLEGPEGHKDSVYSVAFAPNSRDLVSGSLDKTIKMWELAAPRNHGQMPGGAMKPVGRCIKTFEGHRDFVLSVALTPENDWVLSGSKDRGVQFWDPRTGHTQLMLQGHKNSVISVAPSPASSTAGGWFATGSGDMRARIWSYTRIRH